MKKSREDIVFETVNIILVTIFFIIILYPLLFVVSASISDPTLVSQGEIVLMPKGINLDGYKRVLAYDDIWIGYRNTIFYTIAGTLISLVLTLTAAYPLARRDFVGKNFLLYILQLPCFFRRINSYLYGRKIPGNAKYDFCADSSGSCKFYEYCNRKNFLSKQYT
jgi:carbohydrate ABC transporter membrane protein 2, CUT1 family (TC 3.A.1.1.-)